MSGSKTAASSWEGGLEEEEVVLLNFLFLEAASWQIGLCSGNSWTGNSFQQFGHLSISTSSDSLGDASRGSLATSKSVIFVTLPKINDKIYVADN